MRAARELLLTLLAAATVLVAVGSWSRITSGISHAMLPVTLTGAVVVVAGVALRLGGVPRWITILVQLALAWSVVSIRLTHTPVPLRYAPRMRLENAFVAAGNTVMHTTPPVPVVDGVLPFVLFGAALAFVAADLLARTFRLTAISGLVLLAVLAVPISVVSTQGGVTGAARSGISPWLFALVAAGWLAQIACGESDRLMRWGRQVDEGRRATAADPAARTRSLIGTVAVGGTATVLALVVPFVIPTLHLTFNGFGSGGGNGQVTVTNPMVDVRRNLQQGADIPLVDVRTNDPDPSYLRIAVLTRFTATQWSAGDRSIPTNQDAHGPVPISGFTPPPSETRYRYQISVKDEFASRWLPTPAPITAINAPGDWRYDVNTDDFIAAASGLTTAGLSYDATRIHPDLSAAALNDMSAGIGEVPALYTDVPSDLPPIVGQLARQVTSHANGPFEQAVALQDWFRSTGDFTYSTATDLGSGATDLATFLGTGNGSRTGYCQQFAAAMAAMARTLDIPSRVAVGFLTPTQTADGTYVYSSHDMHAWPELYFAGAGWVRFEPTPAEAGTAVPSYAHNPKDVTPAPADGPTSAASSSPSGQQSAKPRTNAAQDKSKETHAAPAGQQAVDWVVGAAVVLIVLAGLVALPAAVRRRRRRTRLTGGAEDAWGELRDTAIDLGLPWADDVSPRATRKLLNRCVGTQDGHVAFDRLVNAVERERYSTQAAELDPQVLRDVLEGLREGVSPRVVRRASWWPQSVLRRRRISDTPDRPLDRVG